MPAPANKLAFDFDQMAQAVDRWKGRAAERTKKERALREKRFDEVEPKERLAMRVNRLRDQVRELLPADDDALPESLRELVDRGPVSAREVNNHLFERVIGDTRDFLSMEFVEQAVQVSRCIGRIVTRLGGGRVSYGTGFLVSPRLLMTNQHVLPTKDDAARSGVEFDYQRDRFRQAMTVHRFALEPATFFLNDKDLDFALVAVAGTSDQGKPLADFGYCPLVPEEGKISIGECINIVQHPRGEMKQIVIRQNKLLDLPEKFDHVAHYEADTEPGSSGSPVFSDQWEVVALHHMGVPKTDADGNYLDVDGRVWRKGDDPTRLAWVANEGIRVSRLVRHIAAAPVRAHEKALRRQLLDQKPPAPLPEGRRASGDDRKPAVAVTTANGGPAMSTSGSGAHPAAGTVTVTIPLHVTVSLGTPAAAAAAGGAGGAVDESLLEVAPDPDYASRPGYDPDFLGFPVPLPKLSNAVRGDAVELDGQGGASGTEIKYYHYSVIMNRRRRLAFVAAVNYHAGTRFKHTRERGDRWFVDPRVPRQFQTGEEHYARNPLDRGHLVRRADAAWGESAEEARLANDDTFHFPNCSPQHEVYNQSQQASRRGLLLWGNLENHIAEQARRSADKKVTVFNGPIFRPGDPEHRGLPVPREFWKIVVFEGDGGGPRAAAFVLSQDALIRNMPEEAFEAGEYRPFQVKVRDLETRTKLTFGNLRDHDALEEDGNEGAFAESFADAGVEVVPLRGLGDVVL